MNQFNPLFMNSGWGWGLLLPILIWSLFWKGCALWTASKNNQKGWFLALLVLNTVGILEIIYIFYVSKKKWADIKEILTANKTEIK
ncbi:MAG: DUF5652 family protein [Candidatus Pacebacteria bacterium]|nr:DUF5652 family protein [Candidatus Paceibacterota bacterium]